MIDHRAEGGRQLRSVVKGELTKYLDYSNDVLPLYIVVMLARGFHQAVVTENLEAFLGAERGGQLTQW